MPLSVSTSVSVCLIFCLCLSHPLSLSHSLCLFASLASCLCLSPSYSIFLAISFVCPSAYLPARVCILLFRLCLSHALSLSVCNTGFLSVSLPLILSFRPSPLFVRLSGCLPAYLSACVCISVTSSLSVSTSVSLRLILCVYLQAWLVVCVSLLSCFFSIFLSVSFVCQSACLPARV